MFQYPEEMATWKRRAAWLLKDFQSPSKTTVKLLADILDFFNGDTTQPLFVHWCLQNDGSGKPCCADETESLNKGIALLVAFLSKGYAVPLLYRMKHYGPAAAFMRVVCCLHNILPRVLQVSGDKQKMKAANQPGSDFSGIVDTLLADNTPAQSQADQMLSKTDFETLLATVLDEDRNYAAQNGARNSLVQKEVSHPRFYQSSIIIDCLVQRMEHGINFFLRRTKILYDLQYNSHANKNCESLKLESRERFLKVIRGGLGVELLASYMDLLNNGLHEAIEMGLDGTQQQLDLIFQMVVSCMTDLHRRLVQEFHGAPFALLTLCDVPPESFALAWNSLQYRFSRCENCVDAEFTASFLTKYPMRFSTPLTEEELQVIKEIQDTLLEVCTWTPLTSDAVEILNGQTQWCLSRRGKQFVKQGRAAVETSLLARAVKHHTCLTQTVGADILPNKRVASGIRRLAGTRSSNQYTSRGEELDLVLAV